jgi:hypothetical protein
MTSGFWERVGNTTATMLRIGQLRLDFRIVTIGGMNADRGCVAFAQRYVGGARVDEEFHALPVDQSSNQKRPPSPRLITMRAQQRKGAIAEEIVVVGTSRWFWGVAKRRLQPSLSLSLAHLRVLSARLRTPRGGGCDRIVGPRMPRVPSLHFGADGGVAAAPKSGQIACDLHRTVRRGEQFQDQWHSTGGDGRMAIKAEEFLNPNGDLGAFDRFIIDRYARARWN